MFLKIIFFSGTIWSFWYGVARCERDASLELEEKNLPLPGQGSDENNDRINRVKPSMVNSADVSAKDYQNIRFEPMAPGHGRMDSLRNNINVNVNHRDLSWLRWDKFQPGRSNGRARFDRKTETDPIFGMIGLLPHGNNEYYPPYPPDDAVGRIQKYSPRKTISTSQEKDYENSSIKAEKDLDPNFVVRKTLEYLRREEINLRIFARDLRSLSPVSLRRSDSCDRSE